MVDLIKKRFLWIILGTAFFYVLLISLSDAEQISKYFLQIRLEFLFLIFSLAFLAHVIKSFRQKDMLETLGEKIPSVQNMVIYVAGLSLVTTPGGVGIFIKSVYLKKIFDIPTEKSIAVIFLEKYHDLLAFSIIVFHLLLPSMIIPALSAGVLPFSAMCGLT